MVRQSSKLSSYAISRKTNGTNTKNDKKPNSRPDFEPFSPTLSHQIFLQVLPVLVIRHCSKLSSNAIIKEN